MYLNEDNRRVDDRLYVTFNPILILIAMKREIVIKIDILIQ